MSVNFNFFQKYERKQINLSYQSSKVEFICSFLERIHGLTICFLLLLTFSVRSFNQYWLVVVWIQGLRKAWKFGMASNINAASASPVVSLWRPTNDGDLRSFWYSVIAATQLSQFTLICGSKAVLLLHNAKGKHLFASVWQTSRYQRSLWQYGIVGLGLYESNLFSQSLEP